MVARTEGLVSSKPCMVWSSHVSHLVRFLLCLALMAASRRKASSSALVSGVLVTCITSSCGGLLVAASWSDMALTNSSYNQHMNFSNE